MRGHQVLLAACARTQASRAEQQQPAGQHACNTEQ